MFRKSLSLLLAICMLLSVLGTVTAFAADTTIMLGADAFTNKGTWSLANREHGAYGYVLRAIGGNKPANSKDATVTIKVPEDGNYTVWVRVRDFAGGVDNNGNPVVSGVRTCQIKVGDTLLPNTVGNHGVDAYKWQEAGKVAVKKGEVKISLVDSSANYARVEAVALSTNPTVRLPDDASGMSGALERNKPEIVSKVEEVEKEEIVVNKNLPKGEEPQKKEVYFLGASAFGDHLGTWLSPGRDGSALDVLRSPGGQKPDNMKPAITVFKNNTAGKYYLWAWTRDYGDGVRTYKVAVDGKLTERTLGAHGINGFAWEYCGEIDLEKGDVQVEVVDSGANYGRIQGVLLTNSPSYIPPENASVENQSATIVKGTYESNITGVITDPNVPEADQTLVDDEYEYIVVSAKDFNESNLGSWQISPITQGSPQPNIIMSKADGRAHLNEPATFTVTVPKTGIYKVMVRSYDQPANSGRKFQIHVGGVYARECGVHGTNWGFEEAILPLVAGQNEIKVIDHTGNYGRWDMIIITDNLDFVPDSSNNGIKSLVAMGDMRPTKVNTEKDPNRPSDEIAINLNGSYMTFDVPPVLINDRTMVPFRAIFEALGCTVGWDDETQTATGSRNGTDIRLTIDSTEAKVGSDKYTLDSPATLVNSRTLVPLRFVSEALGAKVSWDDANQTVWIYAEIPPQLIMLTPESYYDVGTWDLEGVVTGSFDCGVMRGMIPEADNAAPEDGRPELTKNAKARINVVKDGKYRVFAHSRDYTSSYTSKRTFAIQIDGKQIGGLMGTHGNNGFSWQTAGDVDLTAGEHILELVDTSGFYARCDMILITDDMDYQPSTAYSELIAQAAPIRAFDVEVPLYPAYAREEGAILSENVIGNDKVQVKFYQVQTSNGVVIQNEIYNNVNGTWVKTNNRSEQLGYMVVRANAVSLGIAPQDRYVFQSQYLTAADKPASSYMGVDVFKAGVLKWFVPTSIEAISDKAVKITASTDVGTINAVWEIVDETDSPKVSVDASFTMDGYYTIGAAEGDEMTFEQYYFALAPFRVQSKRVDEDGGIYSEQYLFTPMGTYTMPENNKYTTAKVTKGVVIDPSMTRVDVVKRTDAEYGIGMKGTDGGYQGIAFAPILGAPDSYLTPGQTTSFSYRVISRVADWFDSYKFIAQDIYGVDSYRQHTYASLNEAIFNTRKLSLDPEFSGWDPLDKSYWNIESKNTTAVADPMQALQTYLLTEDENYLVERTLPTIANFMTRGNLQFNSKGGLAASNGYVSIEKIPYPIGSFINIYNMNVRGGLYELTRGRVPYLLETGIQNTLAGKNINGYNSMTPFSDDMYLYQYTGDKKYLESAMKKADEYLESTVYGDQTQQKPFGDFIYTTYYANLPALVDMYELSGEQRYLDAAYYTAQYLVTTLWVPGVTGDQRTEQLLVNYNTKNTFNGYHCWVGDEQKPLGPNDQTDYSETVDAWTAARSGLGLEQASTFLMGGYSGNIIMSMWVGDVLKIAAYTGDEYLATVAENAMVGRFANYSGYYYGRYGATNIQNQENYPYKGPDVSGVYYHHLPPFMAMLEDFLINQAFYRSGQKVEFPYVRQSGYAFFYANHYGFAPGNVYDMNDMWLWIDEGVLDSGNLQIDWVGARKDGKAAFMLMNQSASDVTTPLTFGEKVGAVSGVATIYDAAGNKSEATVENGQVTVTVPAKGMITVAIDAPEVKAPAFAGFDYTLEGTDVEVGSTYHDHGNGKAIVLQMNENDYYVYVYATDKPSAVTKVEMTYTAGGEKKTVSTESYPYEFIVKADDVNAPFSYELKLTATDGSARTVKGGTVKPLN